MRVREPETIEKELQDLRNVIKIYRDCLRKFPDNRVIKLSLRQSLFTERELLKELKVAKLLKKRKFLKKGGKK